MNILIVEDDPMVGQINSRYACKISYVERVDLADTLDKAKQLLEEKSYDLLLLDVYFPSGRGPDLLQWIRSRNISLEVIFITADKSPATVERALHLGAVDYLVKPFKFERFKRALGEVHNRASAIESRADFDQDALDRVFAKKPQNNDPVDLDKGMSYKTYDLVKKEVGTVKEAFTAEQMGERMGIARVTIRRYLDFMEKQGILEVELKYGKIGRPQHYYRPFENEI